MLGTFSSLLLDWLTLMIISKRLKINVDCFEYCFLFNTKNRVHWYVCFFINPIHYDRRNGRTESKQKFSVKVTTLSKEEYDARRRRIQPVRCRRSTWIRYKIYYNIFLVILNSGLILDWFPLVKRSLSENNCVFYFRQTISNILNNQNVAYVISYIFRLAFST